jgi:hypothetical protein
MMQSMRILFVLVSVVNRSSLHVCRVRETAHHRDTEQQSRNRGHPRAVRRPLWSAEAIASAFVFACLSR